MKKRLLGQYVVGVFVVITLTSCSLVFDLAGKVLEGSPEPYPGFTTITKEVRGYKFVIENMRRGAVTKTMRVDRDTATYDAIFFDITLNNISQSTLSAYGSQFQLITDEGTVIPADTRFKGGFDGHFSERKSNDLYPGTKKNGIIGFALKKESNPVKLIFEFMDNSTVTFELIQADKS